MFVTTKKELKQGVVDWLSPHEWNHFVTLTFHQDVTDSQAIKELRVFLKRLNNALYGRRSKRQIPVAPFMEHSKDDRPHFHLLFGKHNSTKINDLKQLVLSTWDKSYVTSNFHLLNNDEWFQSINQESQTKLIRYCLKEVGYDIDCLELEYLVL